MLDVVQIIPSILATAFVGSLILIFAMTAVLGPYTASVCIKEYGTPWLTHAEVRRLMEKHELFRAIQYVARALKFTVVSSGITLLAIAIVNQRYAL